MKNDICSYYPELMVSIFDENKYDASKFAFQQLLVRKGVKDRSFNKYIIYCSYTNQKPSNPTSLTNYYKIDDIDLWLKLTRIMRDSMYGISGGF